jgi:hypothetical protein
MGPALLLHAVVMCLDMNWHKCLPAENSQATILRKFGTVCQPCCKDSGKRHACVIASLTGVRWYSHLVQPAVHY